MSSGKVEPSKKAREYLTEKLKFEIELYEFAVRRLEKQYRSLNTSWNKITQDKLFFCILSGESETTTTID